MHSCRVFRATVWCRVVVTLSLLPASTRAQVDWSDATLLLPRKGHATAYDAGLKRLILFGGSSGSFFSGTWNWDGSRWTKIDNLTVSPPARANHAMAYDSNLLSAE